MAAPGAPGGAPPAYSFAAKQAPVEWRVVSDFHLDPFLSGRDVSPQDLNALDQVASMLEVARIEPPPGVDGMQQASQLARLATILQLSSEYQGTRAEVRFKSHRFAHTNPDDRAEAPMWAPAGPSRTHRSIENDPSPRRRPLDPRPWEARHLRIPVGPDEMKNFQIKSLEFIIDP